MPAEYGLRSFWRFLDFPLINCKIEFDLRLERNCVITQTSITFRAVDPNANLVVYERRYK